MLPQRHQRVLVNALLLPLALLLVVLEDVVWRGALAALRLLRSLRLVRELERLLGRLPGWAALPVFLVAEALGRLIELWALVSLVRGHVSAAAIAYIVSKLVATVVAVFVYQACYVALITIGWFAWLVYTTMWVRDWALARIRPLLGQLRSSGAVVLRLSSLRRWIRRR